MANNYGIVASNFTSKLAAAQVTRWNDNVKRHTLYTICGTQQDGWGLYNDPGTTQARAALLALYKGFTGNNSLTLPADGTALPNQLASPDASVGRGVNQNLFNWVPVSYPAVAPAMQVSLENNWQPTGLSIADSVRVGVDELTRLIKNTPGTFAIAAMSQGAVVASQVLKSLLPGGSLSARYNDCIGATIYGNPCRRAGTSFPGGTSPSGSGIVSIAGSNAMTTGLFNTSIPAWWWEFATPGDFFATTPMNTSASQVLGPVVQSLFNFKGGQDLTATVVEGLVLAFLAGAVPLLSVGLMDALSALFGAKPSGALDIIRTWLVEQIGNPLTGQPSQYPNGNPHILYGIAKPPTLPSGVIPKSGGIGNWTINLSGVNSNSTYVDVGIAYLNARGAAIAPR